MQRFLGALALAFNVTAFAQTPSTGRDYSDLWSNAQESGWGAGVIHQGTILFITLFVYGNDRSPEWYVGSNVLYAETNNGADSYAGPLYSTTGTPFLVNPFVPGSVASNAVGTVTFTGRPDGTATLVYTVNGAPVTKTVTRQTWRANTIAATQYVGTVSYASQCANPSPPHIIDITSLVTLTVTSSTFRLVEDKGTTATGEPRTCTWTGTYSQAGRLGAVTGTTVCKEGIVADVTTAFTMSDLQINSQSFSTNFSAQQYGPRLCPVAGRISGTRR